KFEFYSLHHRGSWTDRHMQIPSVWRLARLEKRLDLRCATRNTSAARRHAPSQHGRYRTPKQLARYAKTPGKTKIVESRK
ncbi:MAG: hypothetical protein ACKN82_06585, partial [Pirellula sp.]